MTSLDQTNRYLVMPRQHLQDATQPDIQMPRHDVLTSVASQQQTLTVDQRDKTSMQRHSDDSGTP